VAESDSKVVGFIHFILHEDVIDGEPNALITALFVQTKPRGNGIGSELLRDAIKSSIAQGATFRETSTRHSNAKAF
jgi:predicted N-acetyltransferase YhbS